MSQPIVNHKIYGENNPQSLYILHGIFGMLDNWHLAAQQLAKHFRVITFDARNHGKSFHDSDNSFVAMAEDLKQLMVHLGDENKKNIVLGHSMGGKTAMVFAHLHPELVEKLIVVDIAPKEYVPGHLGYFRAFKEVPFHTFSSRKEVEDAFEPYAPEMSVRQFLLKNLEPIPEGGYRTKSNLATIEVWYPTIIGALEFTHPFPGETHFIAGEKSGYIKESDKPYILHNFPNTTFHVVPKAGHWVHAENPQGFLDCLNQIV